MPNINDYLKYGETALAAYALNLSPGIIDVRKLTDAGMPDAEAIKFRDTWTVIAQSPDSVDGFSAVLLENRTTGVKTLAIRGSEGAMDYLSDYINIAVVGSTMGMPQYNSLETFYQSLVSSGKLSAADSFYVTGHSLGGFLAEAFTAKHPELVRAAYTYNAPGFGGAGMQLLEFLGITDASAANGKIFNVRATDGVSATAGLGQMLGTVQQVRIEAGTADPVYYHSIKTLTDTLSLYKAYGDLQPSLSVQGAQSLLVSSGVGSRKLEDALDSLRTVFIGSASNDTNKTPTSDREAFFNNLTQLQNNANFKALSGQVQLVQFSASFVSAAQGTSDTALAYRYALLELLPYAVVASSDAQNSTLYGNYTQRLSLYDSSTGQGQLTTNWLTDRAAMLSLLITRNQNDSGQEVLVGGKPVVYTDIASGTVVERGLASNSVEKAQVIFGSSESDAALNGLSKDDHIYGGAGDDTLNGQGGNDYLEGGSGADTYDFLGSFGKDTVLDSDGAGSISFDGQLITNAQAIGERDTWAVDLGAGTFAKLSVFDDPRSSTGKRLVITKDSDTANSITINNFNLTAALGAQGYLGIKLDPARKVALIQGDGSSVGASTNNVWGDLNFDPTTLAGKLSDLIEGTAKSFTLYLNQGAKAGDTITLSLSDLADKFKVVLGDRTVDANGAVITLTEGQTEVPIALIQQGDVSADASMQLSATYTAGDETVTCNAWGVNLKDAGQIGQTMNGDQRAKIIGAGNETQLGVTADKPTYGTYAWSETSWAADGTLINGKAAPDFSDVLRGNAGNDKISGLGGNDALDGGAGNDELDGGVGDDLIGGGTGSDNIHGGDGNDYINSSATLNMSLRLRPTDSWSPPAGQEVYTQGALWGIYKDTLADGDPVTVWSGSNSPTGTDSDVIDGGAGDDSIIAGGGDDRVQGGTGDDLIDGMGGNDVLEGGDGKDNIQADGIIKDGYMNTVAAQYHGADFVDGGAGDDQLTGGGVDTMLDTLYLVATHAYKSRVTSQFHCESRMLESGRPCVRRRFDQSNISTSYARSMRFSGHKRLGRHMDAAWCSSCSQTDTRTQKVPQ